MTATERAQECIEALEFGCPFKETGIGEYDVPKFELIAEKAANCIRSLLTENTMMLEALHQISLCSQSSMSSKTECGRIARSAVEKVRKGNE